MEKVEKADRLVKKDGEGALNEEQKDLLKRKEEYVNKQAEAVVILQTVFEK